MKTKQPVSLEEITEQLQIYRIRQFLGYLSGIICFIWTIVFLSHHPEWPKLQEFAFMVSMLTGGAAYLIVAFLGMKRFRL